MCKYLLLLQTKALALVSFSGLLLQSFEDVLGKVNRFHGKHPQQVVRIAGDSGAQFPHQHER